MLTLVVGGKGRVTIVARSWRSVEEWSSYLVKSINQRLYSLWKDIKLLEIRKAWQWIFFSNVDSLRPITFSKHLQMCVNHELSYYCFSFLVNTRNTLTQASKNGHKPYLFPQKKFVSVFYAINIFNTIY